jgi:hypothetical protein
MSKVTNQYKWQFSSRFRRHAFGWRSQVPLQRIKEALSEIRAVARRDSTLAAEGAVIFLEKISPALEHVDSSSGAIGNAVNNAIETLVPIIKNADIPEKERQKWLERLWEALQSDNMPYIEYLEEYWGELCVTPILSSSWADEFIDMVKHIWNPETTGFNFYKGTVSCLSSLLYAERYDELLKLLEQAPHKMWHYRKFGVDALIKMDKLKEALEYAKDSGGLNCPYGQISQKCEEILLKMGLVDEAYSHYSISSNQAMTYLATFRAIVKKYPNKSPRKILQDLIDSTPENKGKWFAAAKTAGFFDLAIALISENPADPKTLARAAKEYASKKPDFAIDSGMASLRWIIAGFGYEITNIDVLMAYDAIIAASNYALIDQSIIKEKIRQLIIDTKPESAYIESILKYHLNN